MNVRRSLIFCSHFLLGTSRLSFLGHLTLQRTWRYRKSLTAVFLSCAIETQKSVHVTRPYRFLPTIIFFLTSNNVLLHPNLQRFHRETCFCETVSEMVADIGDFQLAPHGLDLATSGKTQSQPDHQTIAHSTSRSQPEETLTFVISALSTTTPFSHLHRYCIIEIVT